MNQFNGTMSEQTVSIPAVKIIRIIRRSSIIALILRVLLLLTVTTGFILVSLGQGLWGGALMAGSLTVLFLLGGRSVRTHRDLSRTSFLIENRQFEEAEKHLLGMIRFFTFHRAPRLGMLQNLAVLRYAQKQYIEATLLIDELLRHQKIDPNLRRNLLLMRAESALEMNDLSSAHAALSAVSPVMPVRDRLKFLELQVDYCVRISAWGCVTESLPQKIELVELMPARSAARVQAMMALSALKTGQNDWANWLKRRAELLDDVRSLARSRPILQELWSEIP